MPLSCVIAFRNPGISKIDQSVIWESSDSPLPFEVSAEERNSSLDEHRDEFAKLVDCQLKCSDMEDGSGLFFSGRYGG